MLLVLVNIQVGRLVVSHKLLIDLNNWDSEIIDNLMHNDGFVRSNDHKIL